MNRLSPAGFFRSGQTSPVLLALAGGISALVLIGLVVGMILVRQNQELRQQAFVEASPTDIISDRKPGLPIPTPDIPDETPEEEKCTPVPEECIDELGNITCQFLVPTCPIEQPESRVSPAPSPIVSPLATPKPSPEESDCQPVPENCIDPNGRIICTFNTLLPLCEIDKPIPTPSPIVEEIPASPSPKPSPTTECQPIPEECRDARGRSTCKFAKSLLPPCDPEDEPGYNIADINRDGFVDLRDFAIMSTEFLRNIPVLRADLNGDSLVDLRDFAILSREFRLL